MTLQNLPAHSLKGFIKTIPLIGPTATKLAQLPVVARARRLAFRGSTSHWGARYRDGGNSGAGSYGRLAEFKAAILNEFVRTENIRTVIEFGCGDGAQLGLAKYPKYVGVDVATGAVERCSARFAHDLSKCFYLAEALPNGIGKFDLALSLDVIFHLVEDSVFGAHMRSLFARSQRHVVIYSSDYDAKTDAPHATGS
jgi:hypothetical protein